jgi:hypothetical protein
MMVHHPSCQCAAKLHTVFFATHGLSYRRLCVSSCAAPFVRAIDFCCPRSNSNAAFCFPASALIRVRAGQNALLDLHILRHFETWTPSLGF